MKVKLLQGLPIDHIHGATKGRVFDVRRQEGEGRWRKVFFMGDAGEECAAFPLHECELIEEPSDE